MKFFLIEAYRKKLQTMTNPVRENATGIIIFGAKRLNIGCSSDLNRSTLFSNVLISIVFPLTEFDSFVKNHLTHSVNYNRLKAVACKPQGRLKAATVVQ
jgi:hypothetical protein